MAKSIKAGREAKKAARRPSKPRVVTAVEVGAQLEEIAKEKSTPVKPSPATPIPKGLREVEVKFPNGVTLKYLEAIKPPKKPGDLSPEQICAIAERFNQNLPKAPKYVDRAAEERAKEEAQKREEFRKKEAEERIRKMRERLGADSDDVTPGRSKSGGTMATAAKSKKAAPKAPSAATAKRTTGGFTADQKLTWVVKENPRSKGVATFNRFAKYFGSKTVGEYLQKGGTLGDLRWDVAHKYLTVSK